MKGRNTESPLDCIIIGAGPGGLQAAIHLGRYNFRVLLCHRPGGRTHHARHIENFLGHDRISGPDLLQSGIGQAERFGVVIERAGVEIVRTENESFLVKSEVGVWKSRFVIAASGARESIPPFRNIERFFSTSYLTCLICDGYRATDKKLLVIDRTINGVRVSLGMKKLFTRDVTFLAQGFSPPPDYAQVLEEEGITVVEGRPAELLGESILHGVKLSDGRVIPCEVILGWSGISLNDEYLEGLGVERDEEGFKILTSRAGESSVPGLFVVGALRHGHSQAVISAGQGAEAAIEIGRRLVDL